MVLSLSVYKCELKYKKDNQIANADGLSCLPVKTREFEVATPSDVLLKP